MQNDKTNSRKTVRGRLLFTGGGSVVIDDLMRHTAPSYQVEKCQPTELNFESALRRLFPHVVVACLSNESKESVRIYGVLEENPETLNLPFIVVGNDVDCDLFRKHVFHINTQIFVRPLDMERFMQALGRSVSDGIELERERQAKNPPVEPVVAPSPPPTPIKLMRGNLERQTILVVDDDVRMLNVIKMHLQDLYDVVVVPSGKLALKYLSKKNADLVLLDYMMPDEDGPAVLQQIREVSPQPKIPVLFLTGVSDKDMVVRGLEFRPNGYLLKPVTRELLLEKVTEILLGL